MIRRKTCKLRELRVEGMTLIELLIVVLLIAILASIAYPNYQAHVLKAHRMAALADMSKIHLELEHQYRNSYQSAAVSVFSLQGCLVCSVDQAQFSITLTASESTYTITATPKNSQLNDRCSGQQYEKITLSQTGEILPEICL